MVKASAEGLESIFKNFEETLLKENDKKIPANKFTNAEIIGALVDHIVFLAARIYYEIPYFVPELFTDYAAAEKLFDTIYQQFDLQIKQTFRNIANVRLSELKHQDAIKVITPHELKEQSCA